MSRQSVEMLPGQLTCLRQTAASEMELKKGSREGISKAVEQLSDVVCVVSSLEQPGTDLWIICQRHRKGRVRILMWVEIQLI